MIVDPRLRAVPWRDLTDLDGAEIARELLLPVPWLVLSLGLSAFRL